MVFMGASVLIACEKEHIDDQKPVIRVIEPVEDEAVTPGNALHFEVMFSDNVALASYKVSIHGAFDGHTHSHNSTTNGLKDDGITTRVATDSVAFEKTWLESDFIALGEPPITGKKQATVKHLHLVIPETVSRTVNGKAEEIPLKEGHYHFIVYCSDESGQESFVAQEIFISYDHHEHLH